MTNLKIEFLYPWLLLLLIPAFAMALFLHLRVSKRYRRTRNRICSLVLYFIVMSMSVLTLAGIHFTYDLPNMETEVILLVDETYSGNTAEQKKKEFIENAIRDAKGVCQVGIVSFGYGEPVYAVPLSTDTDGMYLDYVNAEKPDTTATDIAEALMYTKDLFKNKEVAKVILLSDGLETDGRAAVAVKELMAEGIEVNCVYFPGEKPTQEIQLTGMIVPDFNVSVGTEFTLTATVLSSYEGPVNLELRDNGVSVAVESYKLSAGESAQELHMPHQFATPGLHSLSFSITPTNESADSCEENNVFYSFVYVQTFTEILMVEKYEGESTAFAELLRVENPQFNVSVANVADTTSNNSVQGNRVAMPKTLDELRQYDQVVMVNIANADMPDGFVDILYSYVNDIGGGLLTVGGNRLDENGNPVYDEYNYNQPVPNAYNRVDMKGTMYQEMLPVQAIDYTPPVATMIVIDRSGSMDMTSGSSSQTKLSLAKSGAKSCLDALTDRDYCGIMTLEEKYTEDAPVLPMTQKAKLQLAIDNIETGGGTVFEDALRGAAKALQAVPNVERRHVILVTDGLPSDDYVDYVKPIEQYAADPQKKVTFSFVIIGEDITSSGKQDLREAARVGGGRFHDIWNVAELPRVMREDLNVPEIKAVEYGEFAPQVGVRNSVLSGLTEEQLSPSQMPKLTGFYGTKLKLGADQILKGEFVPIYAQWRYGKGMVGSIMTDLQGVWSSDFMTHATGRQILLNIVNALFPTEDIRPQEIDVDLHEQNYKTEMSVYTKIGKDETIELEILSPNASGALTESQIILPSEEFGFTRIPFEIMEAGTHQLIIRKKSISTGEVISSTMVYKSFSYSEEYNMFYDATVGENLLKSLALSGGGEMIEDSYEIFSKIEKKVSKSYDPRILFMILSLVLFLTDIAVRKFKFKWIHELVREAKAKKEMQGQIIKTINDKKTLVD